MSDIRFIVSPTAGVCAVCGAPAILKWLHATDRVRMGNCCLIHMIAACQAIKYVQSAHKFRGHRPTSAYNSEL